MLVCLNEGRAFSLRRLAGDGREDDRDQRVDRRLRCVAAPWSFPLHVMLAISSGRLPLSQAGHCAAAQSVKAGLRQFVSIAIGNSVAMAYTAC